MKFLSKTIFLALVVMFASCEKEESSTTTTTNAVNNNTDTTVIISNILPGTWIIDDVQQSNGKSYLPGTSTLVSTFTGTGQNVQGTMSFSTNPNQASQSLSYDLVLDIKFQNPGLPNQTQTITLPATSSSGTWAIDNDSNIVYTDSSNTKLYYDVVSKSANQLEISTPINTTIAGQSAGFVLNLFLSK